MPVSMIATSALIRCEARSNLSMCVSGDKARGPGGRRGRDLRHELYHAVRDHAHHRSIALDGPDLPGGQLGGIAACRVLEDVGRRDAVIALAALDGSIDVGIPIQHDNHRRLLAGRDRIRRARKRAEDRQGGDEERNRPSSDAHRGRRLTSWTTRSVAGRPAARIPSPSATIPGRDPRVPLLLDVDTGIDDSLALLYACASPEADLLAVTCCSGNVEAKQVVENTLAVLELAGRDDVEVALGRAGPRPGDDARDPRARGIGYAELPPPRRPVSERHGADVIVETARARPGR